MNKLFFLVFLTIGLATSAALAEPVYSLPEICNKYSDDFNNCQRVPFCQASKLPAQQAGCHARVGYEYAEPLCATMDPNLCNPAVTACQFYQASKAQVVCRATRSNL